MMRSVAQDNASYVLKLAAMGLLILILLSPALVWGIEGDITADGVVNWDDVNSLCERWLFENCSEPNWCNGADIDESNSVDFKDFAIMASEWLLPIITKFSIVLLPDTQNYSTYYPAIYDSQTQWIVDSKDELNIAFVLHEGDVTNYNTAYEWDNADDAMSILDGNVPYVIAVGNHDTGCGGSSNTRDNSLFNQYFPASRFDNLVGTFEPNHMENSYHYFTAGGIDWLILALEFGPRNEALDWANTVVTSHPNRRVMVVTHNYMYSDDTRVGTGDFWNPHYYGLCIEVSDPNEVCNDGEEMWTNFVKLHENISFVYSGHILNDGVGTLVSTGDYYNSVYQMLANYQFLANGGNGWLRILTFYPEQQKVTVETYSPYLDQYNTAPDQQFEFLNVDLTTP
jgi:hypothetical protein